MIVLVSAAIETYFSGMRITHTLVMLALGIAILTGCEFKGDRIDEGLANGERWPFVPAAVRVHPFTTLKAGDASEPMVLEARIEMVDAAGDVTKGVGELRFELYLLGATAQDAGKERQLMRWDASLVTIEQNQRHYDPITRTYSFKLKLEQPPPTGGKLRLDVQLTDDTGRRMTADAPVRAPKKPDATDPAGGS